MEKDDILSDDLIVKLFTKLAQLTEDDRSVILVASGFLELMAETLIKQKCKNAKKITDDNRSYPYSIKLVILNELGIISDSDYKIFEWLRKLRNKAAHQPFFEVSENDLKNITVNDKRDRSLYNVCTTIIAVFWNEYVDVFLPVFAPSLKSAEGTKY